MEKTSSRQRQCLFSAVLFVIILRGTVVAQAQEPANPLLGHGCGVDHVALAFRDLEKTKNDYEQVLGFKCTETRPVFNGGIRNSIFFGNTSYLELFSVAQHPSANKFLSDHDDGSIIAVSIEISDLNKARSWVEGHSGYKLEPYKGYYGQSILIPPNLTHGIWIELFQ